MLVRLGAPTTALCFIGGQTGAECEAWLREKGLPFHAFATSTATRTGTVVRSRGQPETTFLGADAPPEARAVLACAEYLESRPRGSVLAICGSVPGWGSDSFPPLRETVRRWPERGAGARIARGAGGT